MIASIAFRNFKALRHTRLALTPFNLVIGPNGSGKTSLIDAMLRLRTLSQLPAATAPMSPAGGAEIEFTFALPHGNVVATLGCASEVMCDSLRLAPSAPPEWPLLQRKLATIRAYSLDYSALGGVSPRGEGAVLASDGHNLAAVLGGLRERAPDAFSAMTEEVLRIFPEFRSLELRQRADERIEFALRLAEDGEVPGAELSQGMRYLLAILVLAFEPDPPAVLCIEEVDRGIHPRMLREVRDALYRLSHPASFASSRAPVQIITTTHSPYFIDLFRDHPDEIVISHKDGRAARFERLADRPDLPELLREGALGDMWFSGILGGVPEER